MKSDLKKSFRDFLDLDNLSLSEKKSLLERHKLGGVFKNEYPEAYKKYWVINTNHLRFLDEECSSISLKGCLLKGCHLVKDYYDDIGMRFMGDIDLLVNPNEFDLWTKNLESLGFEVEEESRWEANNFKKLLSREKGGMELVVELHSRLFYQEEEGLIWETSPLYSENLHGLKKEDLFVHLCGHLGYQHTFHSLNWLYDIALLIQKEDLDFDLIFKKAQKAKVLKACRITLTILSFHFGISGLKGTLWERFLAKSLLTPKFLKDPYYSKFRFLLVKTIVKDSMGDAFSYYRGWLKNKLGSEKSA
ncbi:MAG: nucleotidyltransferase family protein [Halobacteriovoraceae bacterium]|nr:nucleotidyltransferase family protein [Halobacteriovoraceae bacterium]